MPKLRTPKTNFFKVEGILWNVLLVVAFISLLSVVGTYVEGGSIDRDPKWEELIITPFYFTIQSNFLAFIISFLVTFKLIRNQKRLRTLAIFMAANLIVTFVIYWAVLFPTTQKADWLGWIRTLTLHVLTPIFAVVVFIIKYIVNNHETKRMRVWIGAAYHLIYPLVWLIAAIAIYFILGGGEKDAVYSFLKIKTHPVKFVIFTVGIATFYYLLTALLIFLANPKQQKIKLEL